MNITTQPTMPHARAPSAVVGRFDFLRVEERRPAHLSYEFFSDITAVSRALPSRVWFDLDDTLIRPRKVRDPIIFQGAIVGAMRAFSESGTDVGIFSFWGHGAIWNLLSDNPHLEAMVTHDEKGTPLIRGLEHINDTAISLASPINDVHAIVDEENGVVYFDTQDQLTDEKCRSMKIIGRDEMLIDNDDVNAAYSGIALHFAKGSVQRAARLSLVRSIYESTRGYLGLDDSRKTPVPKFLSESEMERAIEIFEHLEHESVAPLPSL